jgi:hypothetical protein
VELVRDNIIVICNCNNNRIKHGTLLTLLNVKAGGTHHSLYITLDDFLSIVKTALLGFMAAVGKQLLVPPTALTKLLLKDQAESMAPCRDLMLEPRSLDDWIGFMLPRSVKKFVENEPRVRPEEKLHAFNPSPITKEQKPKSSL